jgi:hypothetical protein
VREAEAFIRDALGVTRPTDLTMHAPKPEKTGLKYEYDEKLVKSTAQVTREASNKHTFFMNSRKLFREKVKTQTHSTYTFSHTLTDDRFIVKTTCR